ncbi:MAG: Na+/H+ antiporter subunit E [Planctomycetota bacterium]
MRFLSLALLLTALWISMSGHFEGIILVLGALSVGLVLWLSRRMGVIDGEGVPIRMLPRITPYAAWLFKEIVVTNIEMAKLLVAGEIRTQPEVVEFTLHQKSDVSRALLANSITLTPGTVTMDVDDEHMLVHALTKDAAVDLVDGEMRGRVRRVEGAPD